MEDSGIVTILLEVKSDVARIEGKLDSYNGLREKVDNFADTDARSKSNTHRINKIDANLTWLWRTVAGAIIVAGVSAVVVFK